VLGTPLSSAIQKYYIFLIVAVAAVLFATNLRRSHTGRAMAAVRDRDVAAAVMGVDVARTKYVAFGVSSFLAGIAGAMFAWERAVPDHRCDRQPADLDRVHRDHRDRGDRDRRRGRARCGRLRGARTAGGRLPRGAAPAQRVLSSAQRRNTFQAILVAVFLIVEPFGLYGIWLRIKFYFMAWPFRY
jgi:branched-chain amino acid transport system permease protein